MTVHVRHRCASPEEARALADALAADNPTYVAVSVDGATIDLRVSARSAASARTTCDDLLAGLSVAERTRRAAPPL